MNKELEFIKNTLRKAKQEMRVVTLPIEGKELLQQARKLIIDLGYTEAKLIYRKGAYMMTVVLDKVTLSDLELMGFKKASKGTKKEVA